KIGDRLIAYLDPDGTLSSDTDRNRRRGITIGKQGTDGLSPISGLITPQLRAFLDPLLGKYSRPGVANPDDAASSFTDPDTVDPETLRAAAERDDRTAPQRTHDAIRALLEWGIVTDRLGSHRGLPVTCILTINVEDVENETGVATTATGGTVPIKDALALAERSRPFLAVFDHSGLPLHMGRTKRLASPAQRLALTASLRGCTRPGCDAPASMCAVHHVSEWADGGSTDIENLVLACDHCHARVDGTEQGWRTVTLGPETRYPGRVGWIAPPAWDPAQTPRVNHRHHPDRLLAEILCRQRSPVGSLRLRTPADGGAPTPSIAPPPRPQPARALHRHLFCATRSATPRGMLYRGGDDAREFCSAHR
ncbi:HNH endonuclease signature motif containing protein, partial [Nocardia stercoris]